jgi:glycosyltransferase involved in cell wall biosynthesis
VSVDSAPPPAPFSVRNVDLRLLTGAFMATPIRFREDWMTFLGYVAFDRSAAREQQPAELFYGLAQASLHSLRAARRQGAAIVLHAGNTYLPAMKRVLDEEYRRLSGGPAPIHPALVARCLREYAEADLIRAESQLVIDSLVAGGIPRERLLLVQPGVDADRFRPGEKDLDEFIVAYVGSFSIRKGIHHLISAWNLLQPDAGRLVLHGGGAAWGERLVDSLVQRDDVERRRGPAEQTLRGASVCVVPSIEDGFCLVVMEAMASGTPVIVSDQVGAKDLVTDGVDGFVVPAGDPPSIAERLSTLKDDPDLVSRMGAAARRRVEGCSYDWEARNLSAQLGKQSAARVGVAPKPEPNAP